MAENYKWAGPNAKVAKVLDKYCYGTSKPPFALMLDGAWGCGKTWFIKRFFEEKKKNRASDNELNMIYVSLYGIQNAEEITKAIYTAIHPILGGKVGELGKTIFKGLLKSTLKIDLHHLKDENADLSVVLGLSDIEGKKNEIFRNRILVFDDVERAKMPVSNILALVQPLVESHEDRVILVANEKEIATDDPAEKDRYKRIKEKTVYLTLCVTPDRKNYFKYEVKNEKSNEFNKFLLDNENEILSFMHGSNLTNIRIIYFCMHFGKEIFLFLKDDFSHIEHNEKFLKILYILFGTIIENYIFNRGPEEFEEIFISGLINHHGKNTEEEKQYNKIKNLPHFKEMMLYRNLTLEFYKFIKNGTFNKENILKEIRIIFYLEHQVFWKDIIFYKYFKNIRESGYNLIEKFIYNFNNEELSNDGDVLHVCGLYIMLYKIGFEAIKYKDPINVLMEYIKKYFENLAFHNELLEYSSSLYRENHAHGYMYMEHDTDEFITIKNFFLEEKERFLERNIYLYIENITENGTLITSIEKDPYKLNYLNNNPYLHKINLESFIKNLEEYTPASQYALLSKLSYRFQQAKNESSPLSPEKEWFERLIQYFEKEISSTDNNPLYKDVLHSNIKALQGQAL
ncbi:hypothetical protein J3T99_08885 [Acetobacteraceae bacterium B3987]|nr:hypothetical protein [Acetobacteraceae bacterium B3987]